MTPEVWIDVRARIEMTAAALTFAVQWPNEAAVSDALKQRDWLDIRLSVEDVRKFELGNSGFRELGSVYLFIMSPYGTGIDVANAIWKALSVAFRQPSTVDGLVYMELSSGPVDEEPETYTQTPISVHYTYDDRLVSSLLLNGLMTVEDGYLLLADGSRILLLTGL